MVGPVMGECSCHCTDNGVVTIKGITASTGVTVWNYGPGSYWAQHYGADAISGIVPNLAASLNAYVLSPGAPAGNRPLSANAVEALTITKLLSTDGTVTESATLEGMFCSAIGDTFYSLVNGLSILTTVGLSGGDYLIVGRRVPLVEFDAYTSNTANKTYYLHAHSQRGGNVLIVTKTSSETITIPHDATAAEIKTLFEATSDCTAATVTGGPWPLLKVQVDATWSVAGGDIKSVASDATYTGGGVGEGSCTYTWSGPGGGPGTWAGVDNCTTGTATEPSTPGAFNGEVRDGTCVLSGAVSRNVEGVAASYDTGTGLMVSAVGYEFGRNNYVTPAKMMAKAGSVPAWTDAASLGINRYEIVAADSDTVVLTPVISGTAGQTLEAWTVADPWSQEWQLYTNTTAVSGSVAGLNVQSDTVCVSFRRAAFTAGNRAAATVAVSTAAVAEYDASMVSATAANGENFAISWLHDGSTTLMTVTEYERTFTDADYPNIKFKFHFRGGEVATNGDEMLLGSSIFPSFIGVDSSYYYGMSYALSPRVNYDPPLRDPAALGFNSAKAYYWTFYLPEHTRLASGTQWRFHFKGGSLGDKYTSWLNWYVTGADVKAAILAVFPENTEGGFSNANVYPFGAPAEIINTDFSPLEQGLDIIFAGATGASSLALGVPSRSYFTVGQILIEFQNVTQYNVQGFGAWDRTDADIVWQRTFGTSSTSGQAIPQPTAAWLRGSWVYAYGPLADAEV